MKSSILTRIAAASLFAALAVIAFAATCIPAKADPIAITYSLTGTGTVVSATATTLTLDAQASGSVLSTDAGLNASWNPVMYSDQSVLDLTTSLLNGTFALSLADGDTLTGNVFEDQSAIGASQTGPFTQTLTFTGGTGEFASATGSVSANGFLGTADFTVSGSGTVNASAVPEPASATLILGGLGLIMAGAWRPAAKRIFKSRRQ